MEFLHWFLRRRYMGKQVGVSQNVGCFLRLTGSINQLSELRKDSLGDHVLNFQLIVKRLQQKFKRKISGLHLSGLLLHCSKIKMTRSKVLNRPFPASHSSGTNRHAGEQKSQWDKTNKRHT